MSQENVEIVRAGYLAYNAGDMPGALAAIDPGIEVFDHDVLDAAESYRGIDGMFRWQAHWEASWASWRWEPEEFIDAGDRVSSRSSGSTPRDAVAVWMSNVSMARFGPYETTSALASITTGARPRP
jgi:hypothetical protein